MADARVEQRHHTAWDEAMAEWGEGPRTMKATADWANRWVHRLLTEGERLEIALANAEQRGRIEGMERAAKMVEAESHSAGAQGYAGGAKHDDLKRLAAAIRAERWPEAKP